MTDPVTKFMAVALLVEIVAATIAVGYVIAVYIRSTRQSLIFKMIVSSDIIKVIGGVWIGFLAIYRLADFGTPLPPWTVLISGPVVAVLLAPPIIHAITFKKLRAKYGDNTPPPFHDGD